jgi:hypothetical protein
MSEIKVNKISPRSGTTLTLGDSGDDFIIPAGATLTNNGTASGFASIAWQSTIVTTSTLTAVAGNGYWIDTTSNACTVTLPASASVGDQIIFSDYKRTWGTNAITINQNSLNFQGFTSPNPEYNTSGQTVSIVYSGSTQGWIPTSDDDVSLETPQFSGVTDFLVIAGGGSGGFGQAGGESASGGGAGGYRNSYNSESSGGGGSAESSLTLTQGETYTITVGAGASASPRNGPQNNGNNSSISGTGITTITSDGGGAGGQYTNTKDGQNGGSGGGGYTNSSAGSGTANQGYDGGTTGTSTGGSGGGGAGSVGSNGASSTGGNGGSAVASTITGSSISRAGGGAGSSYNGTGGTPGTGGGTAGSGDSVGGNGTANTGGGGGAGSAANTDSSGGAGGKGVVILRMADTDYSGTTTGSPTVNTNVGGSGETVIIFNDSGSYTA